jgi:hypothetical protein
MKKLILFLAITLFTIVAKGQASLQLVEEFTNGAFKLQVHCMPAPQGMYREIEWRRANGGQVWFSNQTTKTFTAPGKYLAVVKYGTWAPGTGYQLQFIHTTNSIHYGGQTLYSSPQTPSALPSKRGR